MSEKVETPVVFPTEIEAKIQKIAEHSGYTRDEVIAGLVTECMDMAEQTGDKIEPTGFALTVKRALQDGSSGQ
jgi:hypothetical protein